MTEQLNDEKRFYERFYALMRDKQLVSVMERFGIEAFRRSSVLEGFAAFLTNTNFIGRTCVEIGTCNGLTAVVLARYFKQVISIDVRTSALKHSIVDHLGIRNILFVDVKDNVDKAKVIESLSFDAAYNDGDHTNDTGLDFMLTRRGGRVLFHEYWEAQPPVWELVNRLAARNSGHVVTEGKLALWTA